MDEYPPRNIHRLTEPHLTRDPDIHGSTEPHLTRDPDTDFLGLDQSDDCPPVRSGTQPDGYPVVSSRLKKLKTKWRWRWKQKESRPAPETQFSHNPPGHTCGLPCCNNDNEPQPVLQPSSQRGCVPVPGLPQAELCESNFVMRATHFKSQDKTAAVRRSQSDYFGGVMASTGAGACGDSSHVVNLSRSQGSIPLEDVIASRGPQSTTNMSEWPQYRHNQTLPPWEQVRQRCIALPGCSQTQHTMMFLNHQPGETSDFSEADNRIAHAHREQEAGGCDEQLQVGVNPKATGRHSPSVTRSREVTPSGASDLEVGSRKKRLVHSKLPDVPIEDSGHLAVGSGIKRSSLGVDEDEPGDNTSTYADHVYDVLSEVKDNAQKLSQGSGSSLISSDVERRDYGSQLSLSDLDSQVYLDSATDSHTDSHYIYSGSLLSESTNDTDSSPPYPGLTTKHRYLMGDSDYPTSKLRYGNRGKYLNSFLLDRLEEKTSGSHGGFLEEHHWAGSDSKFGKSSNLLDLGIENMGVRMSQFHVTHKQLLGTGREYPWVTSDLDSCTKLRLWDLRLLTLQREGNHYSTFPLRKLTSEDLSVGHFSRTRELGYRHRHHSDVSTDNYITYKLERILPAQALPKPVGGDQATLHWVDYSQLNPFKSPADLDCNQDNSVKFTNFNVGELDILDSWRQFFQGTKHASDWRLISGSSNIADCPNQLHASWRRPWTKESLYPSINLTGSYGHDSPSQCDTDSSLNGQPLSTQFTDSGLGTSNTSLRADTISSSSSFCDVIDRRGQRSPARHAATTTRPWSRGTDRPEALCYDGISRSWSSDVTVKTGSDDPKKRGSAEWGSGRVVDWRRQAEVYRDKNLITLIL